MSLSSSDAHAWRGSARARGARRGRARAAPSRPTRSSGGCAGAPSMSGCSRWASSRRKTGCVLSRRRSCTWVSTARKRLAAVERGVQAERVAEVAIEVAPPERRVAAVGQPEAGLGEIATEGAQDAGLADAGLAEQQHALPLGEGLLDVGDERGLALREPQVGVVDLFGEGASAVRRRSGQKRCHRRPPRLRERAAGVEVDGTRGAVGRGALGGRGFLALASGRR